MLEDFAAPGERADGSRRSEQQVRAGAKRCREAVARNEYLLEVDWPPRWRCLDPWIQTRVSRHARQSQCNDELSARPALGFVSRVTPVQTALRNCTGDEGRPFGFGDQAADPKPPHAGRRTGLTR